MRIVSTARKQDIPGTPDIANVAMPQAMPSPETRRIGDMLIDSGHLTAAHVNTIILAQKQSNTSFGDTALQLGLLSRDSLNDAIRRQFGFAAVDDQQSPLHPSLVLARGGQDETSETIRSLRTRLGGLLGQNAAHDCARFAFCSVERRVGRSFLAANLAIAFAQSGTRTLLVDADFRQPSQHQLFGIDGRTGLSQLLSSRDAVPKVTNIEAIPQLGLLAAGATPPNPSELLSQLPHVSAALQNTWQAKVIIYDTPALLDASDAMQIGNVTDGIVMVSVPNETRLDLMTEALKRLEAAQVPALGFILNRR
jgi:protein-tyrosine kinase